MRKIVFTYCLSCLVITVTSCKKDMPIPAGQKSGIDTTGSWKSGKIFTIAGDGFNQGVGGFSGDGGPATAAELGNPFGVSVDAVGNVYISDVNNSRIRRINSNGIISTFAGTGIAGYSGDGGSATNAELYTPTGITVDALGNVYVAEQGNNIVRKISSNGIISTLAGNGTAGYFGDGGSATAAELDVPWDVAVDKAGNVYIADNSNAAIRKVSTSGIITTVAGGVSGSYSGDGGPATAAGMNPQGVAVDAVGNIYIADYDDNRIRKVNAAGIISTLAGNGYGSPFSGGFSGDGGPATAAEIYYPTSVKVDAIGNVYIDDAYNGYIRIVDTSGIIRSVAGNGPTGSYGYAGDGGPATDANIGYSQGIALDASRNVYIADQFVERIRKVYK